jgi:proline iminopeptidase
MQGPSELGLSGSPEDWDRSADLHCPDGSHLAQFDDPAHYFPGLIDFLTSL